MANDLIDRKALAEELSSLRMYITGLRAGKGVLNEFMTEYRKSVLRIVDEAPAVDAEPVRHGVWILRKAVFKDGVIKVDRLECSECGKTQRRFLDTPYCPKCGARMDGVIDGGIDDEMDGVKI